MNYCYFPPFDPYRPSYRKANSTSSDILIRVAHYEDINELAEVLTHSFHSTKGLGAWVYPLLKLGICEDLRNKIRMKTLHEVCLVASKQTKESNDRTEQIVGTVEITMGSSSFWVKSNEAHPYISNLAVSNSYRRQGIAKKLLLKCEQIALEWGYKELYLHVLENNLKAKKLYLSNGYRIHQIESSLNSFLWKSPRRLFLIKQICPKII